MKIKRAIVGAIAALLFASAGSSGLGARRTAGRRGDRDRRSGL